MSVTTKNNSDTTPPGWSSAFGDRRPDDSFDLHEPARSSRGTPRTTLNQLTRGLKHLVAEPPDVSRPTVEALRSLPGREWRKELPLLADAQEGRLDFVIFVEAESEFASRMGTHRVWFEARGQVIAVNAWTGKVLFRINAVTTESGVGESRAESAALQALGIQLADKLEKTWKTDSRALERAS